MKQTLTFNLSTISSTESKMDVDAFDRSVDASDNKDHLRSFYELMDYINPEFRTKYGNAAGTEFSIPHGSIIVNLKLEDEQLKINAPFLNIPEKGKVPLLRQIAGLNFNNMDLAQIALKDGQLFFEYSCPVSLIEPYKIYYILEEICLTGDKYDDEFATKFGAERIYEPKVTPYDEATVDAVYNTIQLSCNECFEALKYFENVRKYGFAWNITSTTLMKILYYANPQGQLLNDLKKAVRDLDREDIPLPEVVALGKKVVEKVQAMPKEKLAEELYFVETFIPSKRRSNLNNIQENFEEPFKRASAALEQNDAMSCCMMITYQFYRLYYYNNLQDDVNAVVSRAFMKASAKTWEEAAPILHEAMEKIIDGDLSVEDDNTNLFGNIDMSAYMDTMQQAMQGFASNVQGMMSSLFGGKKEEDK